MLTKRILVTGGFGYIGSRLTPHLLQMGHHVLVVDLMLYNESGLKSLLADPRHEAWEKRFSLVQADIRNADEMRAALRDIDVVIHLAAISNDPTGEIDEVMTKQINFDAVGMLVALARDAGVRRFINASSSSVFGARDEVEITEVLEPAPLTCYSKYKMLSEWLVVAASSRDFCAMNVRPATVCGVSPRQRFDLTVNKLTLDAVTKRMMTVHGGNQRRPNVGMADMVNLYGILVGIDPALITGRTFNFGFENLKVIEIAKLIQDELPDLQAQIVVSDTVDQRDYHISSEKIVKVLGYRPISSIRQEVKSLRRSIEAGQYPDTDAPQHYNLKSMALARDSGCYRFLSK